MQKVVDIENIEELRHEQGIDDVDLWKEIEKLGAGDFVKLTLVSSKGVETVTVRITSIKGLDYRGKLVKKPTSPGFRGLQAGLPLAFRAANIHSVVHRPAESER